MTVAASPPSRKSRRELARAALDLFYDHGTPLAPALGRHGRLAAAPSASEGEGAARSGATAAPGPAGARPSLDTRLTSCSTALPTAVTLAGDSVTEQQFRERVARYLFRHWPERALALRNCGKAGLKLACKGCGEPSILPFRCQTRTCPHAQRQGAAAMGDRLTARVRVHDLLQEAQPWDGVGRTRRRTWRLVTLTMPVRRNSEGNWDRTTLRTRVRWLRSRWMPFWRSTRWGAQRQGVTDGRRWKRNRKDTSYIIALEVGPTNGMPHIHALIYGEYIDQAELAAKWAAALGEPVALVDVRTVDDPAHGVREVVKYLGKGLGDDELNPRHAAHLELAFRNVHRASVGGALRGVKVAATDAAHEDVLPEDVHDDHRAGCEACGTVGEWKWAGLVSANSVKQNGRYGRYRVTPHDLLPVGLHYGTLRHGLPAGFTRVPLPFSAEDEYGDGLGLPLRTLPAAFRVPVDPALGRPTPGDVCDDRPGRGSAAAGGARVRVPGQGAHGSCKGCAPHLAPHSENCYCSSRPTGADYFIKD